MGERSITIRATAHVDGADRSVDQAVHFGNGPLVTFRAPPDATDRTWQAAYQLCNGFAPTGADDPASWTSADNGVYRGGGKMPTISELEAVSPVDVRWHSYTNLSPAAHGAANAAGWQGGGYSWTGVAGGTDMAWDVATIIDGKVGASTVGSLGCHPACRR